MSYRRKPLKVYAAQFREGKPGEMRDFLNTCLPADRVYRPIKDGNKVVAFGIYRNQATTALDPGQWVVIEPHTVLVMSDEEFQRDYEWSES